MTEGMSPIEEESRQLYRSLIEKVLDKACSDLTWKQQLLDDPDAAMRAANFPEIQKLEEMLRSVRTTQEVEAHSLLPTTQYQFQHLTILCCWFTYRYYAS